MYYCNARNFPKTNTKTMKNKICFYIFNYNFCTKYNLCSKRTFLATNTSWHNFVAETFKSLNYYDCNICVKSKLTKCSISPKSKIIEYEYMMYLVKRINIPFWRNTQCFIIIVVHIMYQCSSKSKLLLGNVINWDYMNICLLNYSFWE